jgi:hypothetical protein
MATQTRNGNRLTKIVAVRRTGPVPGSATVVSDLIDGACQKLMRLRKKPLLVLYYPPRSSMTEDDVDDVYQAFRDGGTTIEKGLASMDVLIDSYGGNPVAAYRIAQLIRDFSKQVSFLVADHAYSAATLLSFAGNEVRLAHFAGLSPIDVTLVSETGSRPRQEVELASIDSFLEFSTTARKKMEELMEKLGRTSPCCIDSDLMVQMVKEVGALQVGKFFRARTLTGHYAEQLLRSYMFAGQLDKKDKCAKVIANFLFSAPTHEFHLDYHFCQEWGVTALEMPTKESDTTKSVVEALKVLANRKAICPHLSSKLRIPFIRFYKYNRNANGRA